MHTTTPMYQYLMALPSRTLTTRGLITYPDTATQELTAEYISSWRINEGAGSNLPIGGVGSASLDLKLDNRSGEWNPGGPILGAHELDGAIISLELGVYDPEYSPPYPSVDGGTPSATSGSYDGGAPDEVFSEYLDGGAPMMFPFYETHWSNVGTYVAEASIGQEQEPLLTIKAQDYLANYASTLFIDGLTYPQTIIQIMTEACSQAGITLKSTNFTNSTVSIGTKPVWPDGTVCRDVISYVACIAAGFAMINRNGTLDIVGVDDSSDYALTTARYKTLENREKYGAFNSVTAESYDTRAETRVEVSALTDNEHNSILIKGNPLIGSTEIATILAGMLTALGGLTFNSAKLDWQGDPTVTLGDVLGVTDKGSNAYVVPVYKQTLNFDSGFGMTSENDIGTITRKSSNLSRLFTSSGRLNSLALEGDIKIRAGENIHVLAGGNINMTATNQLVFTGGSTLGDLLGNTGIKSSAGATAPASPSTGDLWFDTANFNVCKRWSGSAWVEYTQGKLGNSKLTIDGNGVAILSGGTFTVASNNFMIDSSGNVSMKGAITSSSGTIGGFTLAPGSLSAQASGKPLLKLDTANSRFELGNFLIDYGWDVSGVLHPRLYATLATMIEIPQVSFVTGSGTALVGIGTAGLSIYDGGAYIEGTVDADDYLYHTPAFTGEAISLISKIKDDGKGNIDHSTMPIFARRNVKSIKKDKDGKSISSVADGASLVAMISILTKAVQELDERIEKIENRTK